jgi:LPXTG-motif cell wall-anchored protein
MRWSRMWLGLAVLVVLLLAAPASAAGSLTMVCPRCDHVDVDGDGLRPNATLVLVIRDVRNGQEVVPETKITTDGSGSFSGEYDVDLNKHPALLGSVYDQKGDDLELAAHTRAQAPAHCKRATSLPYSGSASGLTATLAGGLLAAGGLLLFATRRRAGPVRP